MAEALVTRFRIADDVAWVSDEGLDDGETPMAYMTRLPRGAPFLLEGSACVVWLALAEGGTLEEIIAGAAAIAGADPDEISGDVADLVDQLEVIGLATRD